MIAFDLLLQKIGENGPSLGVGGGGWGGSWKTSTEERLAYGGLEKLADLRGAWQERWGGVFDRGLIPQCNAYYDITTEF